MIGIGIGGCRWGWGWGWKWKWGRKSTRLEGFNTNTRLAADVDGTDTRGAVDLVGAHGHEVNVHGVHVEGKLTEALGSVRVEEDLREEEEKGNN